MKKLFSSRILYVLGFAMLLSACSGSGSSPAVVTADANPTVATADVDPQLLDVAPTGASSANENLSDLIDTLPLEPLNDTELNAVIFMREEEKLARDVYLYLYDLWGTKIFNNIATSEQTHTDAVLRLIVKYDLTDPSEGKLQGEFLNPTLQGIYDMLIAQGTASLIDALVVGATIEDLDIFDLRRLAPDIDNEDIVAVFANLEKGSRNHMRAFSARLEDLYIVYTPVYISQEEYDAIINTPMETGRQVT